MNYRMFFMIFVVLVPVSGSFCVRPTAARSLFGNSAASGLSNQPTVQEQFEQIERDARIFRAQQLLEDIRYQRKMVVNSCEMTHMINAYALLKECSRGSSSELLEWAFTFIQAKLNTTFSLVQKLIYYAAKKGIKSNN